MTRRVAIAVLTAAGAVCAEAPVSGEWVQLLPMGRFQALDGRGPWLVADQAHARAIAAASQARMPGKDLVVDYDHQSEAALAMKGGTAPASGWIKAFDVRDDGVWGQVEWTAAAAAKLEAKEYRYISPVFTFEKPAGDGSPSRVIRILRAGLTNNPALPELAAAASLVDEEEDSDMDLKALAKALGLAETATEAEVLAACSASAAAQATVRAIAKAGGLAEDATETAICAAIANPDPAKFVPVAALAEVQTQLKALQDEGAETKASAAVDEAMEAGKVSPAMKAWATDYAKRDLPGFKTYVAAAAVIVTPGGRRDPVTPPGDVTTLTAEEKAVCAQLGLTEDAFLAQKKKDAA